MNRVIAKGVQAREELTKGADYLADCVQSTLGPYGENWYLDKKNTITNDGVSVAREIQLTSAVMIDGKPANEINNRGAKAIREAAIKTVDEVGDGTTTATVLARATYKEISRYLASEGVFAKRTGAELRKQLEEERVLVTNALIASATPIDTEEALISSAIVSLGDKELGTMVGQAQFKLGKEGRIIVEEDSAPTSSIEYVPGIVIDNGIANGGIINNQEKQILDVEKTAIILTSFTMKSTSDFKKIGGVLETLKKSGTNTVVIIARAWTDDTASLCLANIRNGFNIYPLSAPYVNMSQKMKDLAALTGATYYDSEGFRLEDLTTSDVGFAEKVEGKRMESIIVGKQNDPATDERVAKRVKELQDELQSTNSDFEVKHISERIAQLTGGLARLKVGAQSEMERRRLFDKADDAVNAARAAYQEGTVKGAGLAFKEIAATLPADALLKRPLLEINNHIMSSAPKGFVIEDWVRDPVKVLRIALENACACAIAFAMAGGVVTVQEQKSLDEFFKKNAVGSAE